MTSDGPDDAPGTAETLVYILSVVILLGAVLSRLGLSLHPFWGTLLGFLIVSLLVRYRLLSRGKRVAYEKARYVWNDIREG